MAPILEGNDLLAALPAAARDQLRSRLEPTPFTKGQILYQAGATARHLYFPTGGLVSLVALNDDGQSIELTNVGSNGVVGLPLVLCATTASYSAEVLIPGWALRGSREALLGAVPGSALTPTLLRYANCVVDEIAQIASCHQFHPLRRRLADWLVRCADRCHATTIALTQDALASALGVARTRITSVMVTFQDADLIRYRYGRIRILDETRLEGMACKCRCRRGPIEDRRLDANSAPCAERLGR